MKAVNLTVKVLVMTCYGESVQEINLSCRNFDKAMKKLLKLTKTYDVIEYWISSEDFNIHHKY